MSGVPSMWSSDTATWRASAQRVQGEVAVWHCPTPMQRMYSVAVASTLSAAVYAPIVGATVTTYEFLTKTRDIPALVYVLPIAAPILACLWLVVATGRTESRSRRILYTSAAVCAPVLLCGMFVAGCSWPPLGLAFIVTSAILLGLCLDAGSQGFRFRQTASIMLDNTAATLRLGENAGFLRDVQHAQVQERSLNVTTASGRISLGPALERSDWDHILRIILDATVLEPNEEARAAARREAPEALGVQVTR